MCGGGVRSILLLPLVARCGTIDVCIWRMFVFMSVVVIVCGSAGLAKSSARTPGTTTLMCQATESL